MGELELTARKYCSGSQQSCQEQKLLHTKRSHTLPLQTQPNCFLTNPTSSEEEANNTDRFQNQLDTAPVNVYAFCDNTASHSTLDPSLCPPCWSSKALDLADCIHFRLFTPSSCSFLFWCCPFFLHLTVHTPLFQNFCHSPLLVVI